MVKGKLGAAAAPAPKGDPAGKYTLNGWGQTEADFAFFSGPNNLPSTSLT
jgi:hypothetical protein